MADRCLFPLEKSKPGTASKYNLHVTLTCCNYLLTDFVRGSDVTCAVRRRSEFVLEVRRGKEKKSAKGVCIGFYNDASLVACATYYR